VRVEGSGLRGSVTKCAWVNVQASGVEALGLRVWSFGFTHRAATVVQMRAAGASINGGSTTSILFFWRGAGGRGGGCKCEQWALLPPASLFSFFSLE
jgi:hypothetical protein